MVTKQDGINKLTSYLFHHQEKNVAIPLITGKKQPVKGVAYKGSSWTWQDFKACSNNLMRKGDTFHIGILARSLLVLDADNSEMMDFLEADWCECKSITGTLCNLLSHRCWLQKRSLALSSF